MNTMTMTSNDDDGKKKPGDHHTDLLAATLNTETALRNLHAKAICIDLAMMSAETMNEEEVHAVSIAASELRKTCAAVLTAWSKTVVEARRGG